jgi:uncharacterized protein
MYTVIKKQQLITAAWKGGTTTQLFIYPPEAEYTKFNFDFRMSYATVEIPASTFTFMPGVTRHLMILRGELEIDHTDRYKKHLKKFDIDVFNGEWPTTAKGMVMDFNLMTRNGAEGKLEAMTLKQGESKSFALDPAYNLTGLYLLSGELEIKNVRNPITLNTGDFIVLDHTSFHSVSFNAGLNCEVIFASVKKAVLS